MSSSRVSQSPLSFKSMKTDLYIARVYLPGERFCHGNGKSTAGL
jgi:hypothetical protein